MAKIGCQRIDCKHINDDCICQCDFVRMLQVDKEGKLNCAKYEKDEEWIKSTKEILKAMSLK